MARKAYILAGGVAAMLLAPAAAQAWTRSYVVEWFEPAFKYGGPANGNPDAPGADCPQGANELDIEKELLRSYRPVGAVKALVDPEAPAQTLRMAFAFRGPNAENIYENPTSLPDPGFREVKSAVAEGFDLDGDPNTGFTGLNGEKGIDNAYYKAAGCVRRYRGFAKNSSTGKYHMEAMHNGYFTVMMVVSGEGADPLNDDKVTVGLYSSKQQLIKDATGVIAADYSYEINPDTRFQTVFQARTKNGVLEDKGPIPLLRSHDSMQTDNDDPNMLIHNARIRFEMKPDGNLEGLIGGYRDWYTLFRNPMGNSGTGKENGGGAAQGSIAERLSRFNSVGFYYSLRRNADGLKDPATGQNTGISVAYRYYMRPAFAVPPGSTEGLKVARIVDGKAAQ